MSKNFQVRLICSIGLFLVAVVTLYAFDGISFKILIALFAIIAMIELFSFLEKKKTVLNVSLLIIEFIILLCGIIYACRVPLPADTLYFWYIIFGVCGYDIFAYLCGNLFGGKVFKKSRPFPYVSKNKTWEGTILGLIISISLVGLLLYLTGSTNYVFMLCGLFALCGDLFESLLKRQFKVKDSNELVLKNPVMDKLEFVVGEKEGHGGFLDRADSLAFTATALLIISFFIR